MTKDRLVPDGRYMAIISQCAIIQKKGRYEDFKSIETIMLITTGEYIGMQINKYSRIYSDFSDETVEEFLKLGVKLRDEENIDVALTALVGKTVAVRAITKYDRKRFYIERCIGSDDVKKYLRW